MEMKSLKITHFFDVIKKEPIFENQRVVLPVEPDLNHVKQEYHCKEELDVTWDERDNEYGVGQENYDFSNDLSYKLGFPIVLIERLPDDILDKYIPTVQHANESENSITLKCKRKGFFQYYHKFCTGCEKREPSEQKTQKCENCGIRWNYECKKCSRLISSYGGIIKHLNIKCIERGYYFACFECNYKSAYRYIVNAHLKDVHSNLHSLHLIKKFKSENVQSDVASTTKLHKCSKCGKQFQQLPPLLRHVQTCGQAKCNANNFTATMHAVQDECLHHCSKCNRTVKNDKVGIFHKKKCQNCHSKFSFKCKQCNQIFQSYSTVYHHVKTKHAVTKDVFKCPECHYETRAIGHLVIHFRKSHIIESHECPQCGRKYKNRTAFNNHSRFCQKEPKFQCDHCSHRTKSKQSLKVHIFQVHTTGNEVDCPQCGNTLKNNKCLKHHITYCKQEPHHQCNLCSFKTKYKHDLKNHYESVHNDAQKKETCPNCAVKLKNKNSLRCHLRRCGKLLELFCTYCHRPFKGNHTLKQHIIRAHSKDNNIDIAYNLPYLHCDDCLYKTKFKCDLAKHVIIHLNNNTKECPKCKKYLKIKYFKKHTEYCCKEPLRCDLCDYQTLTKGCLRRHIVNRHSKGNEIDCSRCGRTYKNQSYLKAHLRRCGTNPHLLCDHCFYKTKYKYALRKHIEKTHIKKCRSV